MGWSSGSLGDLGSNGTERTLLMIASLLCLLVLPFAYGYITSPVRAIPGPLPAKVTNLYRLLMVWRGSAEQEQAKLHERYGPAVAVGPKLVSISDPQMIKTIYSRKEILLKSDFYSVGDVIVEGRRMPSALSIRDEQMHSAMMRPYLRLVTTTNILKYEHLVDKTVNYFLECLDKRFVQGSNANKICDMDNYLHYFSWDVIAEVTFSKRMGFLKDARDVDDMMTTGYASLDYLSLVGQMPMLDNFLDKNPIYSLGPPNFRSAITFSAQRLEERLKGLDNHSAEATPDFLDGFLEAQRENPDVVNQNVLIAYMLINVGAGSDTTASGLRGGIHELASNQQILRKLQHELDSNNVQIPITWAQARSLPYLDAVVRETLRFSPGISHILERVVGANGLRLPDGKVLSPGTIVGVNAYVVNRHKGVFGDDADIFRPERWLQALGENKADFESRVSLMRESEFTFGAGKRMCAGRHLALLETYKLIAGLCKQFDFELAPQGRKWKTKSSFVILQTGLDLILKRRSNIVQL